MTLFEELEWRGLVKDLAGDDIKDKLNNEKMRKGIFFNMHL